MARRTRARRNQQILFAVLSVIVVISMGLALCSSPSVTPVQPTPTIALNTIAPATPVRAPTATATPTRAP